MDTLAQWHQWVNTGALAAFAVFVCWMGSRIVIHIGGKLVEFGERYIRSTEVLHDALKESEDRRQKLCEKHAEGLSTFAVEISKSNNHLQHLVDLHERPDGIVTGAVEDINRMKAAALQACRMCREIAQREIPNSAQEVTLHCNAIEQLIQGSK